MSILSKAFGQTGHARKINYGQNILGQHVNLCIRHAKRRQTFVQVLKTDSTRETTRNTYAIRLVSTYGLKDTGVLNI